MEIIYLDQREAVNVPPFKKHLRGDTKEYPDDFGPELMATSTKQKFEEVGEPDTITKSSFMQTRTVCLSTHFKAPMLFLRNSHMVLWSGLSPSINQINDKLSWQALSSFREALTP